MDSNWKKLLAKKKQAIARQASRNSSAISRNGVGPRAHRKRKEPDGVERPEGSRQKLMIQAGPRRNLVRGFVPDPESRLEEKSNSSPEGPDPGAVGLKSEGGELTQHIAMDCEMVGVGGSGPGEEERSVIARVSIVNSRGKVLYDRYVRAEERITNYRTAVSGILPAHLNGPGAVSFEECVEAVARILKHRILIGHAINHDLKALMIDHPRSAIRDTARYKKYCPLGPRSLRNLAKDILGQDIQSGQHCSVEDARAALALYKHDAVAWERSLRRTKVARPRRKKSASAAPQLTRLQQTSAEDAIHPFA